MNSTMLTGSVGLLLLACGGVSPENVSQRSKAEAARAQDLLAPPGTAYYRARHDARGCPSPRCGGFFLQRVNSATTRCPDGRSASECYVADLDLVAVGSSDEQEAAVRARPEACLLRGYLGPVVPGSLDFGLLRVTEAWQGHPGVSPSGMFLRAHLGRGPCSGECDAGACSSVYAEALNLSDPPFWATVDLTGISVGANAVEQLATPAGLLIAAELTTPGDSGAVALSASEYYMPLSATAPPGTASDAFADDGASCNFASERDGGLEGGASK